MFSVRVHVGRVPPTFGGYPALRDRRAGAHAGRGRSPLPAGRGAGDFPIRRRPVAALLCALLLAPWICGEVPIAGGASPAPDVEEKVREIASELRCVVCQNLSVADSPSDLAKEMRDVVRELVLQGKSREEVQAYFVSRYGEFVLLAPTKRGFNLIVWVLPFLALVVGAGGVYLVARRWTGRQETAEPAVDPAYADRVRRELREREGAAGS